MSSVSPPTPALLLLPTGGAAPQLLFLLFHGVGGNARERRGRVDDEKQRR